MDNEPEQPDLDTWLRDTFTPPRATSARVAAAALEARNPPSRDRRVQAIAIGAGAAGILIGAAAVLLVESVGALHSMPGTTVESNSTGSYAIVVPAQQEAK
jgi:hypothetical protein